MYNFYSLSDLLFTTFYSSFSSNNVKYEQVGCICADGRGSRRSRKSRPFRQFRPSCFMNGVGVLVVVVLCCVGISLGQPHSHPKSASDLASLSNQAKKVVDGSGNEARAGGRDIGVGKDGNKASPGTEEGPSPKTILFFGEDTNGVPIVLGTWFRFGSYTLAFAMFGTGFLASCAAAAIYYVLFVVTEPSQQVRRSNGRSNSHGSNYNGQEHWNWNVGRILRALQIAYETYETLDPYSPICQLKTVCEIQESGYFEGSVLKRLTHYLIHSDMVEKKIQNSAELRAADKIGNDPKQQCNEKFSGCRFSLNKLYENYMTL